MTLPKLTAAEKRAFVCPKCGGALELDVSSSDGYTYSVDPLTGALKLEASKNHGYEEYVHCTTPGCEGHNDLPEWSVDGEEFLRWEDEEEDEEEDEP